jgi:glucose/arabinose dehydrogenase
MLRANCTRSGILRAAVVLVGVLGWCAGGAVPRTQAAPPVDFTNELVAGGLSLPTSIIFLPDGRMLIAEKGGTILIADPASIPATPSAYMTISDIATAGEQGLLDIALDPDFLSNGWFYAYYAHATSQRFRIARFDHLGATGDPASETLIWEDTSPFTGICCHHGGSINFGPDGKLYLTTGDEFDNFSAQSLSSTAGKVLRMNPDGSVPADNPFVDGPGGNEDHIWAYGFRNAFRARWDLPTGRFFIGEVGGNNQEVAWEDINLGVAGANYGWPICEGFCSNPAFTDPLYAYPHLGLGASLTGGVVYRGGVYPTEYDEVYFFADYVRGWLHYLTFDAFGQVTADLEFDPAVGSVVDIKQGPGGEIYYCELIAGEVRRYAYDAGNPTAVDDRAYVDQSGAVAIDVLANDIGVLNPATVTQVDPPSFGSLAIATDGVITYTHGGVGLEEDSFSYTVDDSDGDTSNVAVVSVRVLDGNCALVIDGLALHLRADNGVGLSGSDVVTWADQSGLDNDLSVAGGAPQWVANAFGQLPAVRFDGLDDALGLASPCGICRWARRTAACSSSRNTVRPGGAVSPTARLRRIRRLASVWRRMDSWRSVVSSIHSNSSRPHRAPAPGCWCNQPQCPPARCDTIATAFSSTVARTRSTPLQACSGWAVHSTKPTTWTWMWPSCWFTTGRSARPNGKPSRIICKSSMWPAPATTLLRMRPRTERPSHRLRRS